MKKIKIAYFFSAGYRCTTSDFSIKYGFRKYSSPFDFMCVDFASILEIIHSRFSDFFNDIVILDGHAHIVFVYNKKRLGIVRREFHELLHKDIKYMRDPFTNIYIRFNQNYTRCEPNEEFSHNLYDWPRICIHHHHNVADENVVENLKKRCDRFLKIHDSHYQSCLLLHITKILSGVNVREEMTKILDLKNKCKIKEYMVYIMCCDDEKESEFFIDRCLFIIKRVPSYQQQFDESGTDNNITYLNYDRENEIIRKYFDIELADKTQIDSCSA